MGVVFQSRAGFDSPALYTMLVSKWFPQTMDWWGYSCAWEAVVSVVMQRKLGKPLERWPSVDLQRSVFQGLDFVGWVNASVKNEIQVRWVENWGTSVLEIPTASVTDGPDTCEYFLEKSDQMVLSPRGQVSSILCCGQGAQNPARFIPWGGSRLNPREGEFGSWHQKTQSWPPWGVIWGTSQSCQESSMQCLCYSREVFFSLHTRL